MKSTLFLAAASSAAISMGCAHEPAPQSSAYPDTYGGAPSVQSGSTASTSGRPTGINEGISPNTPPSGRIDAMSPDSSSSSTGVVPPPVSRGPSPSAGMLTDEPSAAIDDQNVVREITVAILADSSMQPYDIEVSSRDGNVTLSGTVSSPAEAARAQQIAQSVDGVKQVENALSVDASVNLSPPAVLSR